MALFSLMGKQELVKLLLFKAHALWSMERNKFMAATRKMEAQNKSKEE